MAIIKKGTYRWNDVLTLPTFLDPDGNPGIQLGVAYITSIGNFSLDYDNLSIVDGTTEFAFSVFYLQLDDSAGGFFLVYRGGTEFTIYTSLYGWNTTYEAYTMEGVSGNTELLKGFGQIITFSEDFIPVSSYEEAFVTWANENLQEYSEEIAPEETPTVDSIKSKLQALINKANEATGRDDANLDNAVSNLVAGYGTGGGGDIIEVTELPTENINEDALYKMGDSYYQYGELVFDDVIITEEGSTSQISWKTLGIVCSFNTIPTKTTENIKITIDGDSLSETAFHFYYIEDENDIFVYGDINNTGTADWTSMSENLGCPFNGIISDASEITEQGNYYYAVMVKQWKQYVNGEVVIKVDELPVENIQSDKLYKLNDGYYKYAKEFKDLLLVYDGEPFSYIELMISFGMLIECYYVKTRPTDNIKISGGQILYLYYVEDEDDVLAYGDLEGNGEYAWSSILSEGSGFIWGGAITSISEAIINNYLYALVDNGWKEYIIPDGNITITENGTYDVTDKVNAIINLEIPDAAVSGIWMFNETIDDGLVLVQDVKFTTTTDGVVPIECIRMEVYEDSFGDFDRLIYHTSDSSTDVTDYGSWLYDSARIVDFGAKPQLVRSEFRDWLEYNAVEQPTDVTLQEKTVIENGEVTADEGYDGLSKVTVNVPNSPLPVEISTEEEMTALLSTVEIGSIYKYTGTTGIYENGALYVVEESE